MANKLIDVAKASAIAKYTTKHNTAKDYDDFMELKNDNDLINSMFIIWEPFETYRLDDIQYYMESEYSTTLELLQNTLKTLLVNVDEMWWYYH